LECARRILQREQDDAGVWSAPRGALVAWLEDPHGSLLSVVQYPAGLGMVLTASARYCR